MDYIFLFTAVFCFSGQFAFTKLYQTKSGTEIFPSLIFSLLSGVFSLILFAVLCGFTISFNWFSFLMAAGKMLSVVIYTIISFKMMSMGGVAIYTMFVMLGGMIVPFLYGIIFLDEQITLMKVIGMVLLLVSLIVPEIKKEKGEKQNSKWFLLLGILVFFANGAVGVFTKVHQISEYAISSVEFSFWASLINVIAVFALVLGVSMLKKDKALILNEVKNAMPKWWIILLFALASQGGALFELIAAKTIDSVILFPVTSGGTIVVSAIFGSLFFKEKPNKLVIISLAITLFATVLFVL